MLIKSDVITKLVKHFLHHRVVSVIFLLSFLVHAALECPLRNSCSLVCASS